MKKSFIWFALASALCLKAEIWFDEGLTYRMEYYSDAGPDLPPAYGYEWIGADTIVEGKTIRPVYCRYDSDLDNVILWLYIDFSDSDKVYYCMPDDYSNWKLLYDFSLAVGDSCRCYRGSHWKFDVRCTSVEENYLNSGLSAVLINPCDDNYIGPDHTAWLRGIGSEHGLIENCWFDIIGGMSRVLYVDLDGERVYTSEYYSSIKEFGREEDGRIHDLQGRRVISPRAGQMYISEGKLVRY